MCTFLALFCLYTMYNKYKMKAQDPQTLLEALMLQAAACHTDTDSQSPSRPSCSLKILNIAVLIWGVHEYAHTHSAIVTLCDHFGQLWKSCPALVQVFSSRDEPNYI